MKATGMLCDYAEVAGGKLFISGAGINLVGCGVAEPPHPVSISLAILVTTPWNATNQPHRMTIELISDQGADGGAHRVALTDTEMPNPEDKGLIVAEFNVGRSPTMKPGEDSLMPLALPMHGLGLPSPGSYFFAVAINGTEVDRVSFRVEVITPMNIRAFGG